MGRGDLRREAGHSRAHGLVAWSDLVRAAGASSALERQDPQGRLCGVAPHPLALHRARACAKRRRSVGLHAAVQAARLLRAAPLLGRAQQGCELRRALARGHRGAACRGAAPAAFAHRLPAPCFRSRVVLGRLRARGRCRGLQLPVELRNRGAHAAAGGGAQHFQAPDRAHGVLCGHRRRATGLRAAGHRAGYLPRVRNLGGRRARIGAPVARHHLAWQDGRRDERGLAPLRQRLPSAAGILPLRWHAVPWVLPLEPFRRRKAVRRVCTTPRGVQTGLRRVQACLQLLPCLRLRGERGQHEPGVVRLDLRESWATALLPGHVRPRRATPSPLLLAQLGGPRA